MSFILPKAVLNQHLVILGKTGAGKSSVLRYIVEHLLGQDKRVCIIDPKGDHWGLKSSADGAGAGFPVIMFGDFKEPKASDVPINQHSGRHVAELITSGNRPCVIGFRGWMTSHMVQFWIDFAAGIFNANSGELFLVGDEFHNFAPKGKIMDPQAGKCLHWSNRLLSEGRGLGIVCLLASQRPQKVHNDTLTSCETLVAMRVVHAADRGAVEEWVKGCGDKEQGKEVLNSLAGMARGEAFVWSPEINFGPKRIKFPMFHTFDSFAPPQLQKRVNEKGWADVDLTAVKEKLASVIEKAKQDDPKELRKQITELKQQVNAAQKQGTGPVAAAIDGTIAAERRQHARLKKLAEELMKFIVKITADEALIKNGLDMDVVEKAAKKAINEVRQQIDNRFDSQRRLLENYRKQGAQLFKEMEAFLDGAKVPVEISLTKQDPVLATVKTALPPPQADGNGADNGLSRPQQSILNALAAFRAMGVDRVRKNMLAAFSGASPRSSAYMNNLGKLRTSGLIDYPSSGDVGLTAAGAALTTEPPALNSNGDLHAAWMHILPRPQWSILASLIAIYPGDLDKDGLAKEAGASPTSSAYMNNLGALRSLGAVDYPERGRVRATDMLFPFGN